MNGDNSSSESSGDESSDTVYTRWKLEKRRKDVPFDIENWLPALEEITFTTRFVDLCEGDAEALTALYGHRFLNRPAPDAEHVARVDRLTSKLRAEMLCISQGGHSDGGFMVRLSSRSPKDAAIPSREMYDAEVARLLSEGAPDDTNTSLRAYFEASGRVLRIDDAEGAVNLLSASERVHRDLHEALTARQIYSMKVAIRAWEPSLLQEYEFRGFVYGHKLTALSQYNPYCFYPEQVRKRDELVARLATFWRESVRDNLIGVFDGGYIVDLAILSTGDVVVIELNPFDEQTGAGVFSWQADRELLEHGPLALRLLEAPRPNMESTIEAFISELPRPARQGGSTEPAAVVESAQRSDADEPTPAQACVVL